MRTDEAAIEVMREKGRRHVWYGDPDLICDIAERAGYKDMHPLNRSAAVVGCLAKSRLFEHDGFIRHMGRKYNVYAPVPPNNQGNRTSPRSGRSSG